MFNLHLQIKKAGGPSVPRPLKYKHKKTVGPSEVPTVYWLIMLFVYHGRLAPRLELSHHQFVNAFKIVFLRSLIIGTYFRECQNTCQGKNVYG